jgi:hypothetical protein
METGVDERMILKWILTMVVGDDILQEARIRVGVRLLCAW